MPACTTIIPSDIMWGGNPVRFWTTDSREK